MGQNSRQKILLKVPCLALSGLKLRLTSLSPRIIGISRERVEVKRCKWKQVRTERNLALRAILVFLCIWPVQYRNEGLPQVFKVSRNLVPKCKNGAKVHKVLTY